LEALFVLESVVRQGPIKAENTYDMTKNEMLI